MVEIRQITKILEVERYSAFRLLSRTSPDCRVLEKIGYAKDEQEEKEDREFGLSI